MAVDYPCNFRFDSSNHILSWDGVPKAIEYEIIYKAFAIG